MTKEYVIYYGSIFLSAILAGLAQKYARDKQNKFKLNKIFFYLSIVTLVFVMGFRTSGVGVDDNSYNYIFNQIIKNGPIKYFISTKLEIGYIILNYIIAILSNNNFQMLIFISTLIPTVLFYKAIEYERKNINLFLAVFLFGTILFLYFFAIIRLFIAASIVTYALKYVFEKKNKNYIFFVLLATTFHYSAIFMLILMYFSTEKENKPRSIWKSLVIVGIVFPIGLFVLYKFIIPIMGNGKYINYIHTESTKITIRDFDKIPFIILSIIFLKDMYKSNKNIKIYIWIYMISLILVVVTRFVAIDRLQWYLIFPICIILPSIVRVLNITKYKYFNILFIPLIIFYGALYSYFTIQSSSNEGIRNYSNILFEKDL